MTVSARRARPAPPAPAHSLVEQVTSAFTTHFARLGFVHHPPEPLISPADPSVLFIGSTISGLKPYLVERRIPDPGLFAVQPSLRTRNIEVALDPDVCPGWCSYFPAVGTLSPADRVDDLSASAWAFFADVLGAGHRLVIRAGSGDADLLGFWRARRPGLIELDGCPPARYRHTYGIAGVGGRNYNFAFPGQAGLRDVGNLVLIEMGGEPIGVELAFGVTTLLAALHDAPHPVLFSPISEHLPVDGPDWIKLADTLTASIAMLREGLRPVVSNRGRILRRYLQATGRLRARVGLPLDRLEAAADRYERDQFGASTGLAPRVRAYLARHDELVERGASQPEMNRALATLL
jgi:hypothetical protein